jgi:hypothetical protein
MGTLACWLATIVALSAAGTAPPVDLDAEVCPARLGYGADRARRDAGDRGGRCAAGREVDRDRAMGRPIAHDAEREVARREPGEVASESLGHEEAAELGVEVVEVVFVTVTAPAVCWLTALTPPFG